VAPDSWGAESRYCVRAMVVATDPEIPRHVISLEVYEQMIAAGILGEDDRVQLLEGVIVDTVPPSPEHADTVDWLNMHFAAALVGRAVVRVQNPLRLPAATSQPEPDLSLIARDRPKGRHPEQAFLVIEVALSSLRIDRIHKARIYARAGVPEYWLVDPEHGRVEVRRDPREDAYAQLDVYDAGATIAPQAFPDVSVDVGALLAGGGA